MNRTPRIYLHPERDFISIGFSDTNDTLLPMPTGWRDRDTAVEWVVAIERLIREKYGEADG